MCLPLAAAALVVTAISTAVSVAGAIQQGKQASKQAKYEAAVDRNNATVSEWKAKDAERRGDLAESQHRAQVRKVIGAQTAALSGSGFELGDETSVALIGDTAMFGEMDAQTLKSNAAREAWGFRVQGSNYEAQAGLADLRASNAKTQSYWQAGGSLLKGASAFAGGWSSMGSSVAPAGDAPSWGGPR